MPVSPEVQFPEELIRGAAEHPEILTHIGDMAVRALSARPRSLSSDNNALCRVYERVSNQKGIKADPLYLLVGQVRSVARLRHARDYPCVGVLG